MRKWRNWQTRTFEGRVVHSIRVQVPSSAPNNVGQSPAFLFSPPGLEGHVSGNSPVDCFSVPPLLPAGRASPVFLTKKKSRTVCGFFFFLSSLFFLPSSLFSLPSDFSRQKRKGRFAPQKQTGFHLSVFPFIFSSCGKSASGTGSRSSPRRILQE